jgi:hypothetical protein
MLDTLCQELAFSDINDYNPDTIMGLLPIDIYVASKFAPKLLRPLKYGENGVFFWIPGSGMTTIVKNIFSSKAILRKYLPYSNMSEIISFWGNVSTKRSFLDLLKSSGFNSYELLEEKALKLVDKGKELVCILGRIDNYPQNERISILKHFVRLTSLNRHRLHILFHSFDKPWFEEQISKYPELLLLANNMEIVPVLFSEDLKKYIREMGKVYEFNIGSSDLSKMMSTYGGMLQLTKEYIRSHSSNSNLDIKFKVNWNDFPKSYKSEIENRLNNQIPRKKSLAGCDLEKFGIIDLKVFSKHQSILNFNPENCLKKILTSSEEKFWDYLKSHQNSLISKDLVTEVLRPGVESEVSLWAIDQAVSRFRKKLTKAGVDADLLVTVKGRGYIWKG